MVQPIQLVVGAGMEVTNCNQPLKTLAQERVITFTVNNYIMERLLFTKANATSATITTGLKNCQPRMFCDDQPPRHVYLMTSNDTSLGHLSPRVSFAIIPSLLTHTFITIATLILAQLQQPHFFFSSLLSPQSLYVIKY